MKWNQITLQTVQWTTSSFLRPSIQVRKNMLRQKPFTGQKKEMDETSEGATEEDLSPRTDRYVVDIKYTEQNNRITVYKLHWQNIWYKEDDWAGRGIAKWRPPLHRSDLEEGRTLKIISSKTEKIRVKYYHCFIPEKKSLKHVHIKVCGFGMTLSSSSAQIKSCSSAVEKLIEPLQP